jgi:hypothetical protein
MTSATIRMTSGKNVMIAEGITMPIAVETTTKDGNLLPSI